MTTWYDATADATTIYSYYKGGNLAKIFSNGDFISFTYGGGDGIADRIVVYDGQLLSYDMIGNPLTYRDGMSFTWKNGRQLATFTQGQTSASYNYNESGIRTDKTVNGITTTYQLDGSKIVSENRNGTVQSYFYDESGSVLGMVYNGSNYYFRKNFRNDVLAILNASGAVVVGYSYDPWGNILSVTGSMASTLGVDNPFRYRSYYCDTESGLYYLNSRYYDAKVCRFVNADTYFSTGQGLSENNMFVYCGNNPVNRLDPEGTAWWHWVVAAVVVVACAAAVVVTAGGAAAGLAAVAAVGSGAAASTTASTVAAAAFIGSATALIAETIVAAEQSETIEDFCDKGSWETVANVAGTAFFCAGTEYISIKVQSANEYKQIENRKSKKEIGKPFDPHGEKLQIGVDPKTITPSKDLSSLDPIRLKNVERFGREQAIVVTRMGRVVNGNHRLANAIIHKRAIDVVIFY